LTLVDSCSRFCIWRDIRDERSDEIQKQLESVFSEFGPPNEIYLDNGTPYQSARLQKMMESWGVRQNFTAVHRPQGNKICKRNHRTIKTMAVRMGKTVIECVIWYNGTTGKHTETPYEISTGKCDDLPIVREMRVIECTTDVSLSNRDDENDYGVLAMNPFKINNRV